MIVHEIKVQVNALYPEAVPLQTTPPSILLNLLPPSPELDDRIVGRNLVLRDTGANIIAAHFWPGRRPRVPVPSRQRAPAERTAVFLLSG